MFKAALSRPPAVYSLGRSGQTRDISRLDPGSAVPDESDWGGLTSFASRVGDFVASIVSASEAGRTGAP
jgi:hypothetical protein